MNNNPEGGRLAGTVHGTGAVFLKIRGFFAEISDFKEKMLVLKKDSERCIKVANKKSGGQFWRRMAIKNTFAWLEGAVYGIKKLALSQFEKKEIDFSVAELALLREEKYKLDSQGEIVTDSTNYQKFTGNLRFSFACLAKSCETSWTLDETMTDRLKQIEQIRNRLTHPKKSTELVITNGELVLCEQVHVWFGREMSRLFRDCDIEKPVNRQTVVPPDLEKIAIHEPYIVILHDGRVYGFERYRQAKALIRRMQKNKKIVERPLFIRSSSWIKLK